MAEIASLRVGWNWQTQLCDQVRRDILTKAQFERLMSDSGVPRDTTCEAVLCGETAPSLLPTTDDLKELMRHAA